MSNYTKTTDFEAKDSLPTGDSGKIIRGAEFETEFDAISTAIATKADTAGPTFTGTLTFETISDGTIGVTAFVDEDDMSSDSATLVPTQQSVKAYVDSQVTAQDLDFQADTGGALSIDLDSETLTFTGGTGVDTSGSGNAVTFAIDSTVATLTGTQTLTNKTLTSPDVNTPDIDGGTIDGTVIGGTTPAAVSATTVSATGNITVGGTVDGRDVATDGTKLDGIEAGATADQTAAEIRTLVESATDSNVFTDADHSKLDGIEAGATGDQTNAEIRAAVEAATDSNVFTDADHSKLDGIEAGADVTDTANVTAAGALMDSEVTNLAQVKAFDSADYATAAQGTTADSALQNVVEDTTPQLGGDLASNGNDILFADNDKAIFGAGSDLQIYHSGSQSFVQENGTGQLVLDTQNGARVKLTSNNGTENMVVANKDGDVELYYDGAQKLATTSTGIDVTGTVTADGLTVDASLATVASTGPNVDLVLTEGSTNTDARIRNSNGILEIDADLNNEFGNSSIMFAVDGTDKLKINNNGDISFYEDTGTTAKFFWDASAESLGIGTSSPNVHGWTKALTIDGGAGNSSAVELNQNGTKIGALSLQGDQRFQVVNYSANPITFHTNGIANERMRIDSAGNVGINTDSPAAALDISQANARGAYLRSSTTGSRLHFLDSTTASVTTVGIGAEGNNLVLHGGGTEVVRVASSGNVGIGTNSPSIQVDVENTVANSGGKLRLGTSDSSTSGVMGRLIFGNGNDIAQSIIEGISDGATDASALIFKTEATGGSETERMRIDASGNVGIGNTAPSAKFTNYKNTSISGSAGATLSLEDDSQPRMMMVADSSTSYISSFDSNPITFSVTAGNFSSSTGTERMRIGSDGNVAIGTTSTSSIRLNSVTPTANHIAAQIENSNTADSFGLVVKGGNDANDYAADFRKRDNTNIMRIRGDGNVGINQSNPTRKLHVTSAGSGVVATFGDSLANNTIEVTRTTTNASYIGLSATSAVGGIIAGPTFTFSTSNSGGGSVTERMRITSSGQVGIGTDSPRVTASVIGLTIGNSTTGGSELVLRENTGNDWRIFNNGYLGFIDDNTERMRIDASGNLLVGQSATALPGAGNTTTGISVSGQYDAIFASRASGSALVVNRNSDGDIQQFRKDGTTVGSIGVNGDRIYFAGANEAVGIDDSWNAFVPLATSGGNSDADTDLGNPSSRFKDLYLSSAVRCPDYRSEGVLFLTYDADDSLQIRRDNGAEAARFDSSGNLLVGLTSEPTANEGGVSINPTGFIKTSRNGTSAKTHIQFFNDNGSVGSISTSASSTAFNTSSDQRLKNNIVDAPSASDDIDAIQVRSFDWKADGSHQKYGMVAQELQSVAPEAVSGDADSDDMMGVDYSKLVPMILKEIQSLRARVAQLEGAN